MIDGTGARQDVKPPVIDVILATNRRSPYLPEALASIEAQTSVDCNLVIVDDGSNDPAYVRSCASNIARAVVVRQAASGLSAARNRGLRECSADFVAFLDDDDAWHPTKAAKQVAALARDPNAVMCGCWGWYVDASGKPTGSWAPVEFRPATDYLSGEALLPRIVTLLFTRAVCSAVGGFDESVRHVEDLEFTLRAMLHGGCTAVREKLVYYRQHDSNVSRGGVVPARDERARMTVQLIASCESQGHRHPSELLRLRLRQTRDSGCLESLQQLRWAIRHSSGRVVATEAKWLLRHAHWLPSAAPALLAHLRNR
jgi:CTP:molybdopterin cytidylyltransferase MocA